MRWSTSVITPPRGGRRAAAPGRAGLGRGVRRIRQPAPRRRRRRPSGSRRVIRPRTWARCVVPAVGLDGAARGRAVRPRSARARTPRCDGAAASETAEAGAAASVRRERRVVARSGRGGRRARPAAGARSSTPVASWMSEEALRNSRMLLPRAAPTSGQRRADDDQRDHQDDDQLSGPDVERHARGSTSFDRGRPGAGRATGRVARARRAAHSRAAAAIARRLAGDL